MKFAVSVITPPGYLHSQAFTEIAQGVHHSLLALGHDSVLTHNLGARDRRHIILGANLLAAYPLRLPSDAIIYNLEQITPGSTWLTPQFTDLLRRHSIWDYSARNIATLKRSGITATHVPIGYAPVWTRFEKVVEQDIDVAFVGSLNERRANILNALRESGVGVTYISNLYGTERDALLARAKIILNVHFYESKIFEIVRVAYLLANRCFVISEDGDEEEEAPFAQGVVFCDYSELVARCLDYLYMPEERAQMAELGFAAITQRAQTEFLRLAI